MQNYQKQTKLQRRRTLQCVCAFFMGLVLTMGLMTGLGVTQVLADDQKVYKIACDQVYASFSIQQDDGSYKGIDVELLAAIAEEEGFEYELTPMDFSGIIPALISATIDGSIAGMNITDERKESVDYSDGYYESGSALVVNKEDDSMYFTMSQMY